MIHESKNKIKSFSSIIWVNQREAINVLCDEKVLFRVKRKLYKCNEGMQQCCMELRIGH